MYSSVKNKKGDRLIDFEGSISRAYRLLLENNYLPVVLFQQSYTVDGEPGLQIKRLNPQLLRPELAKLVQNKLHEVVQKRFSITPGEYIDRKSKAVELNLAEPSCVSTQEIVQELEEQTLFFQLISDV